MKRREWERIKERARQYAESYAWDTSASELEKLARAHLPKPGETPEPRSDGWYARRIAAAIRACREHIARREPALASAEALEVGVLAGSWPAAETWRKRQEGGESAGGLRRDEKHRRRRAIRDIARERGIDLSTFGSESRDAQTRVVAVIETALWEREGVQGVTGRTIRADIRAINDV